MHGNEEQKTIKKYFFSWNEGSRTWEKFWSVHLMTRELSFCNSRSCNCVNNDFLEMILMINRAKSRQQNASLNGFPGWSTKHLLTILCPTANNPPTPFKNMFRLLMVSHRTQTVTVRFDQKNNDGWRRLPCWTW